jgi:hypothetical protein
MNLKYLKAFSEFVSNSYKTALDRVEHHHITEVEAVKEHLKIIENKFLDI